ncbi:hypothetical protein DPMN_132039 [Dreissena polymorpha]|uniref:Uncharacterized protein n=1 Tax=Dreissena polymorpha TaxID=45954 RepID=A0A9D4FVD4_DREPO|nr:hypothetical protein DPMN_132039 [Dreissena polymorpha]
MRVKCHTIRRTCLFPAELQEDDVGDGTGRRPQGLLTQDAREQLPILYQNLPHKQEM